MAKKGSAYGGTIIVSTILCVILNIEVLATKLKAEMDAKVAACDRIIKAQKNHIDELHLEKIKI